MTWFEIVGFQSQIRLNNVSYKLNRVLLTTEALLKYVLSNIEQNIE